MVEWLFVTNGIAVAVNLIRMCGVGNPEAGVPFLWRIVNELYQLRAERHSVLVGKNTLHEKQAAEGISLGKAYFLNRLLPALRDVNKREAVGAVVLVGAEESHVGVIILARRSKRELRYALAFAEVKHVAPSFILQAEEIVA